MDEIREPPEPLKMKKRAGLIEMETGDTAEGVVRRMDSLDLVVNESGVLNCDAKSFALLLGVFIVVSLTDALEIFCEFGLN